MIINHNLSAMYANRQLGSVQNEVTKSIQKLSSGQRINSAADDASGWPFPRSCAVRFEV